MNSKIIGIECSLSTSDFNFDQWMRGIPLEQYQLYAQALMLNCMKSDCIINRILTLSELEELIRTYGIMEICLNIFPKNEVPHAIPNPSHFLKSASLCSLIYYDAGRLELYIKPTDWLEIVVQNLKQCNPEAISYKLAGQDTRESFL